MPQPNIQNMLKQAQEVMAAQLDCMASWETAEANRAWQEKREAVFQPRPAP